MCEAIVSTCQESRLRRSSNRVCDVRNEAVQHLDNSCSLRALCRFVRRSVKCERWAVVSHCGFTSGEPGTQAGMISLRLTHFTQSLEHILYKQSALFSSIHALCSQSVQKAAGLMKWKWLIITRAMTAALSRHHTLAYLWHCVSGAVLYWTDTRSIYSFYPSSFLPTHWNCVGSASVFHLRRSQAVKKSDWITYELIRSA